MALFAAVRELLELAALYGGIDLWIDGIMLDCGCYAPLGAVSLISCGLHEGVGGIWDRLIESLFTCFRELSNLVDCREN